MHLIKNYIIITLIVLATLNSLVEIIVNLKEEVVSDQANFLWALIFLVLISMWAQRDALDSKKQYPFEYGYLIYILWPILLPYHLISTRGIDGAIQFLGLVLLYLMPFLSGLITYVYFV